MPQQVEVASPFEQTVSVAVPSNPGTLGCAPPRRPFLQMRQCFLQHRPVTSSEEHFQGHEAADGRLGAIGSAEKPPAPIRDVSVGILCSKHAPESIVCQLWALD